LTYKEIQVQEKEYYRNLNTIRCLAAFFVIGYHWLPNKMGFFPFAKIGVDIFFVLSGFLITEILIKSRQAANGQIFSKWRRLGVFYSKRALRIFPAYFLIIILFFYLKYPPLGKDWIYLYTYTTNFLIYLKAKWIYPLSPMWTLAVEEQFYIVWPFFIFFLKGKWLAGVIWISVALSFLFIIFYSGTSPFFFVLPFACMSNLSMGAWLAYLKLKKQGLYFLYSRYSLPVLAATSIFFCLLFVPLKFNFITQHLLILIIAFSLILYSLTSKNILFNKLFSNPVTSYLGKISYGLYLYHHPIPWLVRNLNGSETDFVLKVPKILPSFSNGYFIMLENFIILLLVASLSWFILENPINSLKRALH
jgi:peptidoglycan/LPS O-acetylase OafA/YrhL